MITPARHVALALCLSLVFAGGETWAEQEKKAPIWSTAPWFNWIEQTAAPLDQFCFFINGRQAESPVVTAVKHQESLHVRFPLTYGAATTIEVRRQGESLYHATLFYAPSYERSKVPDPSTYLPFHIAEREKPCQGCHRLTVKPSDYSPATAKEQICHSCHQQKFAPHKNQHPRDIIDQDCLQCHRPEAKPSRWSPDQPLKYTIGDDDEIRLLCCRCHEKLAKRLKKVRFQHGPVGMGGCAMCHAPHAANFPQPIAREVTDLCTNCHEMQEMFKKPFVHQVIRTKGCTGCHHPHGSPYPLQLRHAGNGLCTSCHLAIKKQGDNHPVEGHPVLIKEGCWEAREKLNCVSCHSPHASDFAKLLPEEEMMSFCNHCHPKGG